MSDEKPVAANTKQSLSKPNKPDPLISVAKRNRELDKRMHRTLFSVMMLSASLAVSVIGNVYQGLKTIPPVYFVQNVDGSGLTKIYPVNEANSSPGAVSQLVADQLGCVNSYDFANYKDQLSRCAEYFTKTGWGRFMVDFENAGTKDAIEKRSLVVSSVITKPPKIISEGQLLGALYWDLEVPYTVRYQGQGYDATSSAIAVVKVIRVPQTENPKGLAVAQIRVLGS